MLKKIKVEKWSTSIYQYINEKKKLTLGIRIQGGTHVNFRKYSPLPCILFGPTGYQFVKEITFTAQKSHIFQALTPFSFQFLLSKHQKDK